MNIVTDNSKVIELMQARIDELEHYNLGLANESCAQQKRIAELENHQCDLVYAILSIEHERGGSLGADGQFYYRAPESLFNKAKRLKEQDSG